jgi:hypothetical protein
VAGVLSSAGSTTLPLAALVGNASVACHVREIGMFNTTTTAVNLKLCRISTAGTPGSSATSAQYDPAAAASTGTVKGTYSSTAPTTTDLGYRTSLGAAIGSGTIWTFGDIGLTIAASSNAAVGVLVESGSGQACEIYFVWDE